MLEVGLGRWFISLTGEPLEKAIRRRSTSAGRRDTYVHTIAHRATEEPGATFPFSRRHLLLNIKTSGKFLARLAKWTHLPQESDSSTKRTISLNAHRSQTHKIERQLILRGTPLCESVPNGRLRRRRFTRLWTAQSGSRVAPLMH
jgi:hypothetical protein